MPRKPPMTEEERKAKRLAKNRRYEEKRKARLIEDPVYREVYRAQKQEAGRRSYEKAAQDPAKVEARRAKVLAGRARRIDRARTDPEAAASLAASIERRKARKNATCRARRRSDPVYAERVRAQTRAGKRAWKLRHGLFRPRALAKPRPKRSLYSAIMAQEARQRVLMMSTAYAAADRAVGRSLAHDVRDDVVQSIVVAVLEGTIKADAITAATAGRFVAAHTRDRGLTFTLSLDAPVGEDGATFLDFVAAPDQDLDAALDGLRS